MSYRVFQQCSRCVMDTTDPLIFFDNDGYCNHCNDYFSKVSSVLFSGEEGEKKLIQKIKEVKEAGKGKRYDVIMGLSGGMDSSYVAYNAKKFGLRILAVHLDNGWNSEASVNNIEKCIKYLDADLITHVIDWDEFKNLQKAYLRAGVIDIEVITDHAIRSLIFKLTSKFGIKYYLSGFNFATEAILPNAWVYNKLDYKNIRSINKIFGEMKIKSFPGMPLFQYIYYKLFAKIQPVEILNFIDYNVDKARFQMERDMDWQDYGGKHHESIFTKFYQGHIMTEKFNIDKRKAHFSSLICSGNMTRAEAILLLNNKVYTNEELALDKEYVLKKLGMEESEFNTLMELRPVSHLNYPNNSRLFDFFVKYK
jgi:N-acetyl sugar amidotransferase